MLIYENILHLEEASKERFIKPLYDKENDLLFADDKINDFVDKQKEVEGINKQRDAQQTPHRPIRLASSHDNSPFMST